MALILRNTKTFEIIRTHNKERELGEFKISPKKNEKKSFLKVFLKF